MSVSFGEALRHLRMKQGLSQQQLADMVHVDRSSLASWETDRRVPNLDTISRLAGCLNVNVNELVAANIANAENISIIMVDDEKIILNGGIALLKTIFPNAVFHGFTTAHGALEYAEKNKIDLALLDIELGNMSGLELCGRLLELHPRANIIYLTGYREYSFDAWETGACGFLLKPLSEEKVRKVLERLRFPIGDSV